MTGPAELPDWLTVGAEVAVVNPGRRVAFDTVTAIGKRDIVLMKGDRFNRNRICDGSFYRINDRGFHTERSVLVPRGHQMVHDTRTELHGFNLRAQVSTAAAKWERDRDDLARLENLNAAVTELAEWMRAGRDQRENSARVRGDQL